MKGLEAAAVLVVLLAWQAPAVAQDLTVLDTSQVDKDMLTGTFGPWRIRDESGKRDCKVTLREEAKAPGRAVDIPAKCKATFPVLGRVAAWQLYESWAIGLLDAKGKLLIRFTTPDDTYLADPETDGIFTIEMDGNG